MFCFKFNFLLLDAVCTTLKITSWMKRTQSFLTTIVVIFKVAQAAWSNYNNFISHSLQMLVFFEVELGLIFSFKKKFVVLLFVCHFLEKFKISCDISSNRVSKTHKLMCFSKHCLLTEISWLQAMIMFNAYDYEHVCGAHVSFEFLTLLLDIFQK